MAGRLLSLPPLRDAATGQPLPGHALELPAWHLWTTPLSAWADCITCNGARQDEALVLWLLLGYWAWRLLSPGRPGWRRALGGYAAYLGAVLAFLGWAVLLPRPAARLRLPDPEALAVDFHSHSSRSWDGRGSFTPAANRLWHARTGFGAAFLTDHNTVSGRAEAARASRALWRADGTRLLRGEEISLQDTHIAVLGNPLHIDRAPYDGTPEGVLRFLRDSPRFEGLPVMSLPEYWLRHPQPRWERFAEAGARGFEIVNASPKAQDLPRALRERVVALCRQRGLFMTGVSDNHGWGSTSCVWSEMRLPGHREMEPEKLERTILDALRRGGFSAVRVVERTRHDAPPGPWITLDPPLSAWTLCRTLSGPQRLACLGWVWATCGLALLRRKMRGRSAQ